MEQNFISSEFLKPFIIDKNLPQLEEYLNKIPGVSVISSGKLSQKWWVKFNIDIKHQLAWHVVQELGFVLNSISVSEHLPTIFKPVSPPPYLNGGPDDYLSWVIESLIDFQDPRYIVSILEGRLPQPVDDEKVWQINEDNNEED